VRISDTPAAPPESTASEDEDLEFRLGQIDAASSWKQFGEDLAGAVITGINSWWNHLHCAGCGHTFRRGDRVEVDSRERTVYHLEPGLGCGPPGRPREDRPSEPVPDDDPADVAEFSAGVLAAWPLTGAPVRPLTEADWQVRRPEPPLRRPRCLVCAHTFRPGENVVICPCDRSRPVCGSAVHRDPARGLVCWEAWRPDGRVNACPITLARRGHGW
jgi:hypothetical protein